MGDAGRVVAAAATGGLSEAARNEKAKKAAKLAARTAGAVVSGGLTEAALAGKDKIDSMQEAAKQSNMAIQAEAIEEDTTTADLSKEKLKKRRAFQASLDQTGGMADVAASNVSLRRLFGN